MKHTLSFSLVGAVILAAQLACPASGQTPTWTQLSPATSPSARVGAAAVFDPVTKYILLFGGGQGGGVQLNDTWVWDSLTWKQLHPASAPGLRGMHAIVYDPVRKRIILFGGNAGGGAYYDDTWEWAQGNWSKLAPANSPPPREEHAMFFDPISQRVILFGGNNMLNQRSDTWAWDGQDWTQLSPSSHPSDRANRAADLDPVSGRVILFGGAYYDGRWRAIQDTWAWTGSDWQQLSPTRSPSARWDASMFHDCNRLYLFSGAAPGQQLRDTWVWDGSDWTDLALSPSPLKGNTSVCEYDSSRGTATLFGGYPVNDETWEFRLQASYTKFGTGCSGTTGTPVLAAVPGQMPRIGQGFSTTLTSLPPGVLSVPFGLLGLSRTSWMGNTLPFDLSGIGMTGCSLLTSIESTTTLTNLGGFAVWTLTVPDNSCLIGGSFFQQAFVIDPGSNPLGAIMSNAGEGTIGAK